MLEHLDRIKQINPLNILTDEQLNTLCRPSSLSTHSQGHIVFEQGSEDEWCYYLIQGELSSSRQSESEQRTINLEKESSNYALGNLQPRPFHLCVSSEQAILLKLKRHRVEDLVARNQMVTGERPSITVTDFAEGGQFSSEWMFQILQSSIFKDLPTENIERFFTTIQTSAVSNGQRIIEQGEHGDYYYMIIEGEATVTRTIGQVEFPICQLEAGQSFGEEALVSGLPRNASVSMLNDGLLARLAREPFLELLKKPSVQTVSIKEVSQWLKEDKAILLDVRLESEHSARTIKSSQNIPLYRLRQSLDELETSKKYIVFCDSGARSSAAAFLLTERGYEAFVLEGGLSAVVQK